MSRFTLTVECEDADIVGQIAALADYILTETRGASGGPAALPAAVNRGLAATPDLGRPLPVAAPLPLK